MTIYGRNTNKQNIVYTARVAQFLLRIYIYASQYSNRNLNDFRCFFFHGYKYLSVDFSMWLKIAFIIESKWVIFTKIHHQQRRKRHRCVKMYSHSNTHAKRFGLHVFSTSSRYTLPTEWMYNVENLFSVAKQSHTQRARENIQWLRFSKY